MTQRLPLRAEAMTVMTSLQLIQLARGRRGMATSQRGGSRDSGGDLMWCLQRSQRPAASFRWGVCKCCLNVHQVHLHIALRVGAAAVYRADPFEAPSVTLHLRKCLLLLLLLLLSRRAVRLQG